MLQTHIDSPQKDVTLIKQIHCQEDHNPYWYGPAYVLVYACWCNIRDNRETGDGLSHGICIQWSVGAKKKAL